MLAAYFVLAVLAKLPVWLSPTTHFGGTADAVQTMWFLTWVPAALTLHHNPLVTTFLNYPTGINLMWNTAMPDVGILLWPVTALFGATVTFNVITTAALALSAFFAFLVIRRYVPGTIAAAAGGLLYGFSPALIPQDFSHANVAASAATIPLALLLLDELIVRQRMRWWLLGLLIAALGVFQFFLFEEVFVTEAGAGALVTLVLLVMHRAQAPARRPYATRALALAATVTVVCLAAPLFVQLTGPGVPHHSINDPNAFSTDLLNPLVPTTAQLIAPPAATAISTNFSGNGSEADGYIGLPLLVMLAVVAWRYRHVALVRAATAVAVIATICSLGPNLHVAGHQLSIPLPWWLPGHVPYLRSIIPARLMLYAFLAIAILLAYALSRLWAARRNQAAVLALAVTVLLPVAPKVPLFTNTVSVPVFFANGTVNALPGGVPVLAVPWPDVGATDAMSWQVASGMRFRILGGHFIGPDAPGQDLLRSVARAFSGTQALAPSATLAGAVRQQLHANNVAAVMVGPVSQHAAAVTFFSAVLGAPPSIQSDGVDVWLIG